MLQRLKFGPEYLDPLEKFEVFNIAKVHIKSLPAGIVRYPYTFLVSKELHDKLRAFLGTRQDFQEQLEVSIAFERQWDWTNYTSRVGLNAELIYFISVSQKVFLDTEFRGLILEELI